MYPILSVTPKNISDLEAQIENPKTGRYQSIPKEFMPIIFALGTAKIISNPKTSELMDGSALIQVLNEQINPF